MNDWHEHSGHQPPSLLTSNVCVECLIRQGARKYKRLTGHVNEMPWHRIVFWRLP